MRSGIGAAIRRIAGIDVDSQRSAQEADSLASASAPIYAASGATLDSDLSASIPEVDSCDPAGHALRLLAWLQTDGGISGEVMASEIQAAYAEMCADLGWAPLNWLRTGREFAKLVGPRRYRDVLEGSKRCRRLVYAVPPTGTISTSIERARHPSAPLPARLSAVEQTLAQLCDQVGRIAAHVSASSAGREASEITLGARVVQFERGPSNG